jgi:hypothetical protein
LTYSYFENERNFTAAKEFHIQISLPPFFPITVTGCQQDPLSVFGQEITFKNLDFCSAKIIVIKRLKMTFSRC